MFARVMEEQHAVVVRQSTDAYGERTVEFNVVQVVKWITHDPTASGNALVDRCT